MSMEFGQRVRTLPNGEVGLYISRGVALVLTDTSVPVILRCAALRAEAVKPIPEDSPVPSEEMCQGALAMLRFLRGASSEPVNIHFNPTSPPEPPRRGYAAGYAAGFIDGGQGGRNP